MKWSSIIEGVLFTYCDSKHSSTKHSPFKLLFNREPGLSIDVKYKFLSTENSEPEEHFDKNVRGCAGEKVRTQVGENKRNSNVIMKVAIASNDLYIIAEVLLRILEKKGNLLSSG